MVTCIKLDLYPFKSNGAETKCDKDTSAAAGDGQHDPYVFAMLHRRCFMFLLESHAQEGSSKIVLEYRH